MLLPLSVSAKVDDSIGGGAPPNAAAALIERIDSEDRRDSPDAMTEYRRQLAQLPELARRHENGEAAGALTGELAGMSAALKRAEESLQRLQALPVEIAAMAVLLVPGSRGVAGAQPRQVRTARSTRQAPPGLGGSPSTLSWAGRGRRPAVGPI